MVPAHSVNAGRNVAVQVARTAAATSRLERHIDHDRSLWPPRRPWLRGPPRVRTTMAASTRVAATTGEMLARPTTAITEHGGGAEIHCRTPSDPISRIAELMRANSAAGGVLTARIARLP